MSDNTKANTRNVPEETYNQVGAIIAANDLADTDSWGRIGQSGGPVPGGENLTTGDSGCVIYGSSLELSEDMLFAFVRSEADRYLLVAAKSGGIDPVFGKNGHTAAGLDLVLLSADWDTYQLLAPRFPYIVPVSLREKRTTIGTGDRLGLATPGHIRAVAPFNASPVLAQQSIRELTLTNRTYRGVVADAAFGVFQEGYTDGYGADGDHLKTLADIDVALEAGMPMITLDLTEVMDPSPAEWSDGEVQEKYARLEESVRSHVDSTYSDKRFDFAGTEVHISIPEARRCALMYWDALEFTAKVDRHLRANRGDAYDLEVSIDETTAPTLPSHHYFIANELQRRDIAVNSLAPRFIGEFQKGIDYIGDLAEFETQFKVHSEIAKQCGGYKVSIHSGSDKFSVYPVIGKYTSHRVHVKTAGTSWLEAIRAMALTEPALYRDVHTAAFDAFEEATKLYHITADLSKIIDLKQTGDDALESYLKQNESRQLLHISYGGLLRDGAMRKRIYEFLGSHEEAHYSCVESHIGRHVSTLGVSKR